MIYENKIIPLSWFHGSPEKWTSVKSLSKFCTLVSIYGSSGTLFNLPTICRASWSFVFFTQFLTFRNPDLSNLPFIYWSSYNTLWDLRKSCLRLWNTQDREWDREQGEERLDKEERIDCREKNFYKLLLLPSFFLCIRIPFPVHHHAEFFVAQFVVLKFWPVTENLKYCKLNFTSLCVSPCFGQIPWRWRPPLACSVVVQLFSEKSFILSW